MAFRRLAEAAKLLKISKDALGNRGRRGTHIRKYDPEIGENVYFVPDELVSDEVPSAAPAEAAEPSRGSNLGDALRDLENEGWDVDDDAPHIDLDDDEDAKETIDELIERRTETYRRNRQFHEKRRAVVRVRRNGPFAICHMGDPHLDDDGCDWPALLRDVRTVKRTPHMYAGNVGDTINNWVGKLMGKWRQQSTTEDEAFRLGRWLFRVLPWDYIMLGNHDHWNQAGTVFRSFARGAQIRVLADHEARIEYVGPAGVPFRADIRHDFKGHSMWNNVHGPLRRVTMQPWGDLYVCGHKHTWGGHSAEHQNAPFWVYRVRGYKRDDEYAEAKDLSEDALGCSLTTVIQPDHPHPGERCKLYHDVEEAADFLSWLRSR